MMPTAVQVAAFAGEADNEHWLEVAQAQLPAVAAMVKAYTRGRGFTGNEPAEDVGHVIVAMTARLIHNPAWLRSLSMGELTYAYGTFTGWTLPELAVLNTYRRRAA